MSGKAKRFLLLLAAVFVIVAFVGIQFIRESQNLQTVNAQKTAGNTDLNSLNNTNDKLQQEIDQSKTDEWVVEQAREKLGMVKPGEIKIVDEDN